MFSKDNLAIGSVIFLIIALFFTSLDYIKVQTSPFPTGQAGGGGGLCGDVPWEYCTEPFGTCPGGGVYIYGGSCGLYESCCRIEEYCGDSIVDPPEQCDGLVSVDDCDTIGSFVGGTTSCTSSCTVNVTLCHYCGNGECDHGETCSGCVEDCNGTQADCSSGQLCQNVMGSGTCIAAAPSVCNDTTAMNTCSNITGAPWYCDSNTTLVENCTACGCPSGQRCHSGVCEDPMNGDTSYSGVSYTIEEAQVTEIDGVVQPIDVASGDIQYSWNSIKRRDKIIFEITVDEPQLSPGEEGGESNKQQHTIEVKRVSRARKLVEVTIYSDPIDVTLYEGEPQRVDVDGDGVEDVVVLATDIGLSTFDIDIQDIDKEKLEDEGEMQEIITQIRERRVFLPEPLLSPVFEESPEANMYEFIIVNSLIIIGMAFYFFRFVKEIKKRK